MPTLTQAIRNTKRRRFEKANPGIKDYLQPGIDLSVSSVKSLEEKLQDLTVKNQELEIELSEARKSFLEHIQTIDSILGHLDKKKLNVEQFQTFGGEIKQAIGKIQLMPGPRGEKPVAGVDYPIPRDGRDSTVPGPKPIAGIDYPIPKDGYSPMKGKDYFDGSPDTPEQIANKINTLEEKIEQKTIKGLALLVRNLYNAIREKSVVRGGGMGNVQHETKNLTASTTTVTTTYKISGNGFAVWAFYQGQNVVRGNHYTVGGDRQTLTLTFTPENSTFLDLIYIRG